MQKTSIRGGRRVTVTPEHPAIVKLVNLRNRIEGFVAQIQDIEGQAKAEETRLHREKDIYETVKGVVAESNEEESNEEERVMHKLFDVEKNLENFQYELQSGAGDLTDAITNTNEIIEKIKIIIASQIR